MLFSECKGDLKVGEIVYICDYRFNDIDNQAIRHISPMKVIVCNNDDLPKNKKVYYSDFHFKPIGTNGKSQARIIAPFDNTGYRDYTGVSLNIFYEEKECNEFYVNQCEKNIAAFEKAMVNKIEYYKKKIKEIQDEMKVLSIEEERLNG